MLHFLVKWPTLSEVHYEIDIVVTLVDLMEVHYQGVRGEKPHDLDLIHDRFLRMNNKDKPFRFQ